MTCLKFKTFFMVAVMFALTAFMPAPHAHAQIDAIPHAHAQIDAIPHAGWLDAQPGDPQAVFEPQYTYRGIVKEIYDSDTLNIDIDLGFDFWRHDMNVRLAGTNAYEIKKSRSKKFRGAPIDADHVAIGFKCRDLMIEWLGGDPANYQNKVRYHNLLRPEMGQIIPRAPPQWLDDGGPEVVVQTLKDESGKFGRPLVILWKDGNNLNQWLVRAGCADLNWYDGVEYPSTAPITPDGSGTP